MIMDKKEILDKLSSFLDSILGGSNEPTIEQQVESDTDVVKSVDAMQRRALFVVLAPSFDDGTTDDLHADFYDETDVEKACINFNKHCMKAGLYHQIEVESDLVEIEQSFIVPAEFTTDSGVTIRKGTWCQWMHFPKPDDDSLDIIWPQILSGEITGASVECKAKGYNLDDK